MVVILHVSIDLTNLKLKQTIMELDTNSCLLDWTQLFANQVNTVKIC